MPKNRAQPNVPERDASVIAPRWIEATESLATQIEGLRSTTLADVYTGFAHSLLREKMRDIVTVRDVPPGAGALDISLEQAVTMARSLLMESWSNPALAESHDMREIRGLVDFTTDMYHTMQTAAPVYVTEEMMRLADVATDTLPYTMSLNAQSLLEPNMWLYFEQGLPLINAQGETMVVKAVHVRCDAYIDPTVPGFDFVYFTDILDDRDTTGHSALWGHSGAPGRLVPSHVTGIAFGDGQMWPTPEQVGDYVGSLDAMRAFIRMERFLVTILLMLTQKEVHIVEAHNRAADRRLERARRLDRTVWPEVPCRVVTLRRRQYVGSPGGGGGSVERNHRWWRRGHWRQYKEGKWTYVTGHACGPEDAPFIPRDNVYTWER